MSADKNDPTWAGEAIIDEEEFQLGQSTRAFRNAFLSSFVLSPARTFLDRVDSRAAIFFGVFRALIP